MLKTLQDSGSHLYMKKRERERETDRKEKRKTEKERASDFTLDAGRHQLMAQFSGSGMEVRDTLMQGIWRPRGLSS